jgi:hypothetical protein
MRVIIPFFVLLLVAAPAGSAQENLFSPGGRLRIEAPTVFPGRIEGVVRDFTYEGVHFEASADGRLYLLAPTEIRYLAEYRGRDRGYVTRRRAIALGFIGAAAGAVAGPGIAIHLDRGSLAVGAALGALGGAAVGALGGIIWGSLHSGDVWREYRIEGDALQPVARQ